MKKIFSIIMLLCVTSTLMAQSKSFIVKDKSGNSQFVKSIIFQKDALDARFSWDTSRNGYKQTNDIENILSITRGEAPVDPVNPIPTDGLVAYYPFNGNANDESGHGNNGSIIGHVELATDRFGNANSAYRFFGEPMNYISVPDDESLHISTFTLSAWVYTDGNDYGSNYLINKGRDINNGSYRLWVTGVEGTNQYGGSNNAHIEEIPQTKVWHMITGTIEGDQAKYYLDGVLLAAKTLTHPFTYSNTEPLTLGMHYYSGVPFNWAYPLFGILDDVRIYNRVLTASEIQALYLIQ